MKRLAPVLLLSISVLSSCWLPLFDPEVSASEVLARRLGDPVASATFEDIYQYNARDSWFVPARTDLSAADPVRGLLVRVNRDNLVTSILSVSDTLSDTISAQEYGNLFGDRPCLLAVPNATAYVLGIHQNASSILYDLSAGTSSSDTLSSGIEKLVGAGIVLSATASGRISICYVNSSALYYETMSSYSAGNPPGFSGAGTSLPFSAASSLKAPGSFFDNGTYLYLSCSLVGGTQAIYRWNLATLASPVRYPAAYGPLTAALSDGRLLAWNGQTTTLLSADMDRICSFPSGTLRFVHERYDSTLLENVCVFTRAVFVRNKDDDSGDLKIEVFEIPTSDLSSLGA